MNETIRFYDEQGQSFIQNTQQADMTQMYRKYVPFIQEGGWILDAGCGSGRDTLAFLKMGFRVIALDASAVMVETTRKLLTTLGEEFQEKYKILHTTFDNLVLPSEPLLDGIWACASLLHVQRQELPTVLRHLASFMKPDGVFFMSFKYCDGETIRNGRYFNGYNETSFAQLMSEIPELVISEISVTSDVRPKREDERWLNILARNKFLNI